MGSRIATVIGAIDVITKVAKFVRGQACYHGTVTRIIDGGNDLFFLLKIFRNLNLLFFPKCRYEYA